MKRIRTIKNRRVAITGRCWIAKKELASRIKAEGGEVTSSYGPNRHTDILVRGRSSVWLYGDFGTKEAHAADLIGEGQKITVVEDYEFHKLLEGGSARCSEYIAGQLISWLAPPPSVKVYERIAGIHGPLDREQTIKGRTEQAYLRSLLFGAKYIAPCSICGRKLPIELLVAAHIKPRSECTAYEKRDAQNIVFALCQMGCDALYERGFISVDPNGKVVAVRVAGLPAELRRALQIVRGKVCKVLNEDTVPYFSWHFLRRFQG
jgi:hypothetical protein